METPVFNGKKLNSIRLYRGMTISELAEKADVTKQTVSLYENDGTAPSLEKVFLLAAALNVPRSFFYSELDVPSSKTTYFRSLVSCSKKERTACVKTIEYTSALYDYLSQYIDFPQLNIPKDGLDLQKANHDFDKIAEGIRKFWGIETGPIKNLLYYVELNGIIVTSLELDTDKVDAFSQFVYSNEHNHYIIALGKNKGSAFRRQFDIAHELGHILLHEWSSDIEELPKDEFRQREEEANEFASALLLPRDEFIKDLRNPTDLAQYIDLKRKWNVSAAAMIRRAYQLGAITINQYQYMMKVMSAKGWRTKEPYDDVYALSKPTLLSDAVNLLLQDPDFSVSKFIQDLENYGFPLFSTDIEKLLDLKEGTLDPSRDQPETGRIIKLKNKQ